MANGRTGKDKDQQGNGDARMIPQDAPADGLGPDEIRARNERRGVPGETTRTQGVVESFELMDPKKRAEHMNMKRQGR
jgi:hypothetical protein